MKEQKKTEFKGKPKTVAKKGRSYLQGKCASCGGNLSLITSSKKKKAKE